jgi:ABC-type polysaccharide/polyol phosphate transport system ATPase subunit
VSRSVARVATFTRNLQDVIEGLLAAKAVGRAALEFAVVVELDGAECLVLREVIAVGDLDRFAAVVVPRLFDEFEYATHCSCEETRLV